jgi:hypothetical protein
VRRQRRSRGTFVTTQAPFHKPVEIAAALALSVRVVGPALNTLATGLANTLLHSPLGLLVMSSPWTQQIQRLWQMQTELILRLF